MILFDLDGTLLPLDQIEFEKTYMEALVRKMLTAGFEAESFSRALLQGIGAMLKNNGECTNEAVFTRVMTDIYGDSFSDAVPLFDDFYLKEFQKIKRVCGFQPLAVQTVRKIKKAGLRTAVATNPVFPSFATECRIHWAGFEPCEFELYTAYDNTSFCKPNVNYYLDIAKRLGVFPSECLMVGNDATDDTAAADAGMEVFILTDCLLNREGRDISEFPEGDFLSLQKYLSLG